MDAVKGWAAALCVAAVACALMQVLAPKGGTGKLFKLIIAAFFLCAVTSPLLSLKSLLSLDMGTLTQEVSAGELPQEVKVQFQRQVEAALLKVAQNTLKNYDIAVEKVAVQTDTSEDGSIYIRQVLLYLDNRYVNQVIRARQVMEERLGTDVTVQVME